jgi:hypothetical protein
VTKVPTDIVIAALLILTDAGAIAIEYVAFAFPVTLKVAAETAPVTAGRVTPPVLVLVPAGSNTTVPATPLTATLPKFILVAFAIAIGEIMFAAAVPVADACANALALNASPMMMLAKILVKFFILKND